MKKQMIIALCIAILFSFASCSNAPDPQPESGQSSFASSQEASGQSAGNNAAQIANPWKTADTLEDAAALAGFALYLPDSIEGYSERKIRVNTSENNEMLEVIYKNSDGNEIRIRKSLGDGDISGDFSSYEQTDSLSAGDLSVTVKGRNDLVNLAIWTNGDYAYAVSVKTGLSSIELTELIAQIA